jgi:methylase of polypeptide subunit release factors
VIGEALAASADALRAAGIEDPRLDAEVLLSAAAGVDRAALAADPGAELPPAASRRCGASPSPTSSAAGASGTWSWTSTRGC